MGCGTSTEDRTNGLAMLNAEQGAELLDNFLKVDQEIWKEEKQPPIPSLGECMVQLDKLNNELEAALGEVMKDREMSGLVPGFVPEGEEQFPGNSLAPFERGSASVADYESWDEPILKVIQELNINRRADKALEQEEFIANLTRNAMKRQKVLWLNRRKQEAEEEVARQSERVQRLQALYEYQENILSGVTGRPSPRSALEMDMERLKNYRDTLYSGLLSWVESGRLADRAAGLAATGAKAWMTLGGGGGGGSGGGDAESRFRAATITRNSLQEATLCINAAQASLAGVQFTYCTIREITALYQVLEYLYTDMQIPDRYKHGIRVYNSFQKRAAALYNWIKNMKQETIQKDVHDVDQKISQMASMLSAERTNYIRQAAGLRSLGGEQYGATGPNRWRQTGDTDGKLPDANFISNYESNFYNRGPVMY